MSFHCMTDRYLYQLNIYEDSIWIGRSGIDLRMPDSDWILLRNILFTLDLILESIDVCHIILRNKSTYKTDVAMKFSDGWLEISLGEDYLGNDIKSLSEINLEIDIWNFTIPKEMLFMEW